MQDWVKETVILKYSTFEQLQGVAHTGSVPPTAN